MKKPVMPTNDLRTMIAGKGTRFSRQGRDTVSEWCASNITAINNVRENICKI